MATVVADDFAIINSDEEESLAKILQTRYERGIFLTDAGEHTLISLNPFKTEEPGIKAISKANSMMLSNFVYKLFIAMKSCQKGVSVLITGQSGSGKTEIFKRICIDLMATDIVSFVTKGQHLSDKLMNFYIVLEEFENCETLVNETPSSWATCATFHFEFEQPCLLTKVSINPFEHNQATRNVKTTGQFNFCVFYDMIYGCSDEMLAKFRLTRDADFYQYLKSNGSKVNGANNKEKIERHISRYKLLQTSLQMLSNSHYITGEEFKSIWRLLAAILHLGNLQFSGIVADDQHLLDTTAKLLGLETSDLIETLSSRTTSIGKTTSTLSYRSINDQYAIQGRDIFSKFLFERLFKWIVQKMNASMSTKDGLDRSTKNDVKIEIIDFPGIKRISEMNDNGFEQFCRNYYAEKIQQIYFHLTLKLQQDEYLLEGIKWEKINYPNDDYTCDLVGIPIKGTVCTQNDASRTASLDNNSFTSKRDTNLSLYTTLDADSGISHFAGNNNATSYDIDGFDKNSTNSLPHEFSTLAQNSTDCLLSNLFVDDGLINGNCKAEESLACTKLQNFMKTIEDDLLKGNKTPFYISCILPNEILHSNSPLFNINFVEKQTAQSGLTEVIKIRRFGFNYKMPYPKFMMRYKCLSEYTWPNFRGASIQEGVKVILQQHKLLNQCAFGYTKVFLKSWTTVQYLEEKRSKAIPHIATYIQKIWKGAKTRRLIKDQKMLIKVLFYYRRFKMNLYLEAINNMLSLLKSKEKSVIPNTGFLHTDLQWPKPPAFMPQKFVAKLKKIFKRWRANCLISQMEKERIDDIKLKICAYTLVHNKRVRKKYADPWIGNYLDDDDENVFCDEYRAAVDILGRQYPFKRILFSSFIQKYNKMGKCTTRALLMTDAYIMKLYAHGRQKFLPMKRGMDLRNLKNVTLSSMNDGLIVLDFGDKNDFIFYFSRGGCRVVEFVGILAMEFDKYPNRLVNVIISDNFKCHVGGKMRQVIVANSKDNVIDVPNFKQKRSVVQFYWPSNEQR